MPGVDAMLRDVDFQRAMYLLETAWSTIRFEVAEDKRRIYARACQLAGAKTGSDVRAAIEAMIGKTDRAPSASEVAHALRMGNEERPSMVGVSDRRPDLSAKALQMVRLRLARGDRVCGCVMNKLPRSPQMNMDHNGVLTCPVCKGLENGQVDTAVELLGGP